jgi:hypothetical protein
LYSYTIAYVSEEGNELGFLTKPIRYFATFPKKVYNVLEEFKNIPPTFMVGDPGFNQVNKLSYDLYGIGSNYNLPNNIWEIKLFNFRNDSIIHKWFIKKEFLDLNKTNRRFRNSEPRNSILLPDKSLIVNCDGSQNLLRIDKYSNIIWSNTEKIFHHGMNLDIDNNLWICSSEARGIKNFNTDIIQNYRDDYITKINVETGKIIFHKSLREIFVQNNYQNLVYGVGNDQNCGMDPFHLNDIQPVLINSAYFEEGDLFLSIRNRSLILLYRPENNKIINMIFGPFVNQHDVDIISDKEIAVFNNNTTFVGIKYTSGMKNYQKAEMIDTLGCSEIITYDFENSGYRKHLIHHFVKEEIYTVTQGVFEILSSGDTYVENQNEGKIYLMNEDDVLLRKTYDSSKKGMIERPHWIRIYENLNFLL